MQIRKVIVSISLVLGISLFGLSGCAARTQQATPMYGVQQSSPASGIVGGALAGAAIGGAAGAKLGGDLQTAATGAAIGAVAGGALGSQSSSGGLMSGMRLLPLLLSGGFL